MKSVLDCLPTTRATILALTLVALPIVRVGAQIVCAATNGGALSIVSGSSCGPNAKQVTLPLGPPGPAGPLGPPGNGASSTTGSSSPFKLPFKASGATSGPNQGLWHLLNSATGASGSLGGSITGVYGEVTKDGADMIAVKGISTGADNIGVAGRAAGRDGKGVLGISKNGAKGIGVHGESHDGGRGVYGLSTSSTDGMGVMGESQAGGKGVAGKAEGGPVAAAIYGQSKEGYAGFFKGKVIVLGKMAVDELFAKSGLVAGVGKMFKIDHPLESDSKYLIHASVESPERKNIYDGIVVLDDSGSATVTLPRWFEALNTDFRYQLTSVGGYAAVYVADEIHENQFRIAGGRPGLKVSWQVTGIRHDAVARAHPLIVEEPKKAADRGKYLYPVELGFSPQLEIAPAPQINVAFETDAPVRRAPATESRTTPARRPPK